MDKVRLELPADALKEFCARHKIKSLALFGSVLREDFGPSSDIDVLVEYEDRARHDLWDHFYMQEELERMLGRHVDLINRQALEQSQNWIRRQAILESAQTVYVSR